ncbi:TetR/AcrR family transcriptional regulator [Microbacterium sp.]|uniref:TetR/AcrR family transcriptional regulator n=1 Tax=Microbacterium sp. TaxID=51671 RepID=UPI0039E5DD6B
MTAYDRSHTKLWGFDMVTSTERATKARGDKYALRRRMLAEAALVTLAEHGFANTGLRDIAQHSALSHGSLHYYFEDKNDLVAESVWLYKSRCARRYEPILETATDADDFVARIADAMAATLRDDASMHRLWYDLRNQALFDEGFRDTIIRIDQLLQQMVWSIVQRHADLVGRTPCIEPEPAYALVDGLFQHALIRFLRGERGAVDRLRRECAALLPQLA